MNERIVRLSGMAAAATTLALGVALAGGCGGEGNGNADGGAAERIERTEPAYPLDTEPGGESPRHVAYKLGAGVGQGQGDVAASAVDPQSPGAEGMQLMLREMAEVIGAFGEIRREAEQKFGPEGAAVFGEPGDMGMPLSQEDLEAMQVEIDGDEATILPPNSVDPFHLVRREERWYVLPGEEFEGSEAQLRASLQSARDMYGRMIEITREAVQESATVEELERRLSQVHGGGGVIH